MPILTIIRAALKVGQYSQTGKGDSRNAPDQGYPQTIPHRQPDPESAGRGKPESQG